ncbi:NAD(P)/FAD-dependent oxidoreductase [Hydrogenimonas urashimensis]|uniref:NAD(P)/FAD-dependent oxidoreductase n=1 Tax=Hydrogenimonas urashimensis TaxID=2740515 RepID=UPI001916A39D|nr:FAD-dependent oxidoreductase [Hydrogenimonas urashimensis]
MKHVLVLGGGFAGLEAAIFLRKENYRVTLVSERDYFYIYPTSIWVPVHKADFGDVTIDMNELSRVHGFKFVKDRVEAIRAKENRVELEHQVIDDYDELVVAIGASKVKHEGIEHTLSICGEPRQALLMRQKLDALVERGGGKIAMGFGGNPKDSTGVRGGPAFEMLFNVHHMLKKKGIRQNFELTFFAPMETPGARLGPQALKMMDVFFSKLDIAKHFGKKIKRFEEDGIVFEDESKLESDFTMFIPANAGHPVFQNSDLPLTEAGFVKIDNYCRAEGFDNVWAVGDSAAIEGPDWRAKQGHIAEVMARNTAHNIKVKESGEGEMQGYLDHLNILCVMDSGDGAAFVYRDDHRGLMIPMPLVGHWLKKGWGWYCKNSKLEKIPRIPGL